MSHRPIVRLTAMILPLALVACGGGETATAPVENGVAGDAALPVDEPVYDGDNLTAIDAAATDASIQPLAPDTVPGDGNVAIANDTAQ